MRIGRIDLQSCKQAVCPSAMDMSDEEVEAYASYRSYADYLERRKKSDENRQLF